jgi:hypothetical protein
VNSQCSSSAVALHVQNVPLALGFRRQTHHGTFGFLKNARGIVFLGKVYDGFVPGSVHQYATCELFAYRVKAVVAVIPAASYVDFIPWDHQGKTRGICGQHDRPILQQHVHFQVG